MATYRILLRYEGNELPDRNCSFQSLYLMCVYYLRYKHFIYLMFISLQQPCSICETERRNIRKKRREGERKKRAMRNEEKNSKLDVIKQKSIENIGEQHSKFSTTVSTNIVFLLVNMCFFLLSQVAANSFVKIVEFWLHVSFSLSPLLPVN